MGAIQRVASLTAAGRLTAAACGGDVGQTSAKVSTDVVINERICARVAVSQAVAEDAKHGVGAVLRLKTEICNE